MEHFVQQLNRLGEWHWAHACPMFLQSGALICILAGLDWAMRKRARAIVRYSLWMLLLVKLALPANFSSPTALVRMPFPPAPSVTEMIDHSLPLKGSTGQAQDPVVEPAPFNAAEPIETLPAFVVPSVLEVTALNMKGWALLRWCAGCVAMLGAVFRNCVRMRRTLRMCAPASEHLQQVVQKCAEGIGLKRNVALKLSSEAVMPSVCGFRRPTIILPRTLVDILDEGELKAVLLHELIHVRRHDVLINAAQTAMQALYFYNPLIWLANARIRQLREEAVDEVALASLGEQADAYPSALVSVAKFAVAQRPLTMGGLSIMESQSVLRGRIRRILEARLPMRAQLGAGWAALICAMGICLLPMGNSAVKRESPNVRADGVAKSDDTQTNVPSVRVAKDLLDRLPLRSVDYTNSITMNPIVSRQFIAAFLLTPNEVAAMNVLLTNAMHEFRTMVGRNLQPIDDQIAYDEAKEQKPVPTGTFSFRPYGTGADGLAIRKKFESQSEGILGQERARYFWRLAPLLSGEVSDIYQTPEHTYTFKLMKGTPGPLIDHKIHGPGAGFGRPYSPAFDSYAPEALKPIVEAWRKWIATQPPGTFKWENPTLEKDLPELPDFNPRNAPWVDGSRFVEIPKDRVEFLPILALTQDEKLSPEAIELYGITSDESVAVHDLYQKMKIAVEELEIKSLEFADPKTGRYVIRAFPEQIDALKKEWLVQLEEIIGPQRAKGLDFKIRASAYLERITGFRLRERVQKARPGDNFSTNPGWFDRGTFDIRITISKNEFRYESDRPESGTSRGPKLRIPKRFQHVISPAVISQL